SFVLEKEVSEDVNENKTNDIEDKIIDIVRKRQVEPSVGKEDRNEKEHDIFYDLLVQYDIEEESTTIVNSAIRDKIKAKYDKELKALKRQFKTKKAEIERKK